MKILLISGHGAGDSGALGNGYQEQNLTRELVNLIAARLKKYANVLVYDQNRNAFKDVQNGKFSIPTGINYAFEVHFNAFNGNAHGTECYVTSRENGITVEQEIMKGMRKFFTLRDNDSIFDGVKRTNFLVVNTLKNMGISGALLETCFIDNALDMKVYQANKNAIADAIVNGIVKGFGLGVVNGNTSPVKPTIPKPNAPTTSLKVGDKVTVINPVDENGTHLSVNGIYDVFEVKGNRIVISRNGSIIAALPVSHLKKVGATSSKPNNPTVSTKKHFVGEMVCTNTLASNKNGGNVYKGDWEAMIEKIFNGAKYPYRLKRNGVLIGFTNDTGIDTDPHIPKVK